jgi:hypothetical protein
MPAESARIRELTGFGPTSTYEENILDLEENILDPELTT